jgi:hypothetical protein
MSDKVFKAKVDFLERNLIDLDRMIHDVSQEPETDEKRAALVGLTAAQKYYTDLRIKLHS